VASAKHLLTVSLHAVPQHINFVNPNFYNPQPVTPAIAGVKPCQYSGPGNAGQPTCWKAPFLSGRPESGSPGKARREWSFTPTGNSGNYFGRQRRTGNRWQWVETFTPRVWNYRGAHQLKFGLMVSRSTLNGEYNANPLQIVGAENQLLERIDFRNSGPYVLSDVATGMYAQDHWVIHPRISFDAGCGPTIKV